MSKNNITTIANNHAEELVRLWLPNGRLQGRNWLVGSTRGEAGDSLFFNFDKKLWKDFANPDQTGGDIIALCKAVFGIDFKSACERIRKDLADMGLDPTDGKGRLADNHDAKHAVVPVPENAKSPDILLGRCFPDKPDFLLRNVWQYQDGDGRLLFYTLRFDHTRERDSKGKPRKLVVPYCYFGDAMGWRHQGSGLNKNPLYGLARLAATAGKKVLLVEGEKTCDAAAEIFPDLVSLSWLGGRGNCKGPTSHPLQTGT